MRVIDFYFGSVWFVSEKSDLSPRYSIQVSQLQSKFQRKETRQSIMSQGAKSRGSFSFSKKTGMSLDKAKASYKAAADKGPSTGKRRATSTFVSKLYRDDEELNELKVLAGDGNFDSDVEDKDETSGAGALRKREAKLAQKKTEFKGKVAITTKVGKLKLEKGSVALFAVNEVYQGQYAIVNHTRNVKGYISLKDADYDLTPGQLVIASVTSVGTASYAAESSGNKNRKLQLSLDPKLLNRGITAETVTSGMVLQGVVESKEAKGYMVDLGLKDKSKAFIKFGKAASDEQDRSVGSLVHVVVQSKTSKLIRCTFKTNATDDESQQTPAVKTDMAQVTPHTLKPGFKVSAKVQKLFSNGLEVSFLGGMTGTIFADHLCKSQVTKFKAGEKLEALVISQDIASKATALSLLPRLLKLEPTQVVCSVGQLYTDVKVEKKVFGNSYQIRLESSPLLLGLLHKSNIPKPEDLAEDEDQAEEETKDFSSDDAKKRAKAKGKKAKKGSESIVNSDKDDLLDIGKVLPEVRVKEFNFFDGTPILSMLPSVVQSSSLDYKTLAVGSFHTATVESIHGNDAHKRVVMKIGDFVKAVLPLEHMADHPLKVIPPKFTQVGKQLKVRVFCVDGRTVELTKKDSLIKESIPIYTSMGELQPGMPIHGVVVAKTEHGYVFKSFAGLKGLLRHDDFKEFGAKKLKLQELKAGTPIKAYVQFVKKGSGIALTLSKKKARGGKTSADVEETAAEALFAKYLPSEDELQALKQSYSNLIKKGNSATASATDKYRVCESRSTYYVLKSTNQKKPTVALLPKPLASSFGLARPFENKDFTFEAITVGSKSDDAESFAVPVVCAKPELVSLKDEFTYVEGGRSFVAIIEAVSGSTGITLRFSSGLTKIIALRDISQADKVTQNYSVGQVVRTAPSKSGRLSLKRVVVEAASDPQAAKRDQAALTAAFSKISTEMLKQEDVSGLAIGSRVKAKVQLVKDYGLILQMEGDELVSSMTGFIVDDQKAQASGKYKPNTTVLDCIVLDIDPEKKMVDLSERLASSQPSAKKDKKESSSLQKAVVELNKEQYLVISLKSDRTKIGVCVLHGLSAESMAAYSRYSIGDEIDVKVTSDSSATGGFFMAMPKLVSAASAGAVNKANQLEEGQLVTGTLKSVKGMCAFLQVGMEGRIPIIGRLHQVETSSKKNELVSMKPGDKIEAKVLKKFEDKGRTLIELTRRPEHMKADSLDQSLVKLLSLDTIKNGQEVEALVTDVVAAEIATKVSCPVQVQVSPFVRSQLLFSDILEPSAVLEQAIPSIGGYIQSNFKVGQRVSLTYSNGKFVSAQSAKSSYEKGDLAIVRFVKAIKGFGITVQLNAKTFGSIELSELTDDITANVAAEAQKRGVFIARVIGQDKKGRLQLSSRDSVLNSDFWRLIQPEGTSGKFMAQDAARQANGNMRNKVLKFGAALTFKQGDLAVGYVTNVSKAGCFIQVAHGVSMRAGLNELSDEQDYDFLSQMPIGRVVLARITKSSDNNTRFDCSLRKSLIVYGVHQVSKADLKHMKQVSCLILAMAADNVAFAQVKGSYHKLKVKGVPEGAQAGQLCTVELQKVASDKIVGDFVEFETTDEETEMAAQERHLAKIYSSVQEEARADIASAKKSQADQKANKGLNPEAEGEPDIEQLVANKRKQTQLEEQIRDLQQLEDGQVAALSEAEDEDEVMSEVGSDDSDAEEIRRLKQIEEQQEKEYESSEDEEAKQSESQDEEGGESELSEQEDKSDAQSDMEVDSDSDDAKKKTKSGKKALRAQLDNEKAIRAKEAQLRSADGAQPTSVNDFERMLVADYDQSYLWIQYMAFMLENLDAEAARRVAERAVKQVSMTAEDEKLNLWIAYMNLESKFGTAEQLQGVVKRALDVNDRRKVYLQLINVYKGIDKNELVEDIYKKLCKKYFESLEIWTGYIEFLFEMQHSGKGDDFTAPKTILQRSLQALPKANHVNVISKFGMLEYKFGNPEHGRTMFEGIVTNYGKRMDIWSIYMDMEVKHGGGKANQAQARHLFERCLALPEIAKKPKKMKLVFRKYMEFENSLGNENKLGDLRRRVEEYLETAFKKDEGSDSDSDAEQVQAKAGSDQEMAEESGSEEAASDEESGDAEEGEEDMSDESDE